jgi:hypothetical protein
MRRRSGEASEDVGRLIDGYVQKWLRENQLGRELVKEVALPFDEAVDAVFELLNLGHLKIEGDQHGFTGIRFCVPPEPPFGPVKRPKKVLQ